MPSGIYTISHKGSGKCYIGSAVCFLKRWRKHLVALRRDEHYNHYLQAAWNKYSENAFSFDILELVEERNMLYVREQFFLDLYRARNPSCLYNLSPTAGGTLGIKFSEESRLRLSLSKKGQKYRPMSKEGRENISKAQKNKKMSDAFKRKLGERQKANGWTPSQKQRDAVSAALKGKKLTPEHIQKISLCQIGKPRSDLLAHQARMAKRRMFDEIGEKSILEDRSNGMLLREIASKHGCSVTPIKNVIKRCMMKTQQQYG